MIVKNSELDEDEIIYQMWNNADFRKVIQWINKKITLEISKEIDYRTIDVRLRIATNMLNKLVYESKLDSHINIKVHQNLVTNVKNELGLINTEDLPF
jgi:hypothetical protein